MIAGARLAAPPARAGLHVVATPIGNLGDITLRALETLAGADVIACEDTRVSSRLLARYGLRVPLLPYHEHNAAEMRPRLLGRLAEGASVALISDAGTPLVSDPGFRLVREAIAAGVHVEAVPGPSALLAAMVVSGLPTDRFLFEGFLPPKQVGRLARLSELAAVPASLVMFETGPRLADSLADMATALGGARPAAVCRELTKLHEEVRRGTLAELAAATVGLEPRGEIVVVVGPPLPAAAPAEADIDSALAAALAGASLKDAAAEVAAAFGLPRRTVYQRALDLTKGHKDG
ncbi:16S rRNA (cytidine(1402)-2'-O)-methyltransferase [Blastochloris sulfoviridis]|uniref:Ribosomal RNA small subunit methyltransferase I n=1 Tax=Blastochloris sulfoviridis TaxID=50712 RepID=A0A5M6HX34_9HYPH|nr:16S rRNA (cytidine(1402)-2'-O)-methyltransferase [Blastochloris sulfoviridis]KAA5600471.1 16S rRNA (cytidine(1402)-2'-O)-methyltransferase [Blastochloris sulfoviridis]